MKHLITTNSLNEPARIGKEIAFYENQEQAHQTLKPVPEWCSLALTNY